MKQTIFLLVLLMLMNSGLFGKIEFCVSGVIECHGTGVEGIEIGVGCLDNYLWNIPSIKTNKNGEFSFYRRPGNYEIVISDNDNFVPLNKIIKFKISDKNVKLKIEMIRASKLKGMVHFDNGIIPTGSIDVDSQLNMKIGKIEKNGSYFIGGIHFGEKVDVTFDFDSMFHKIEIVSLVEGEEKELNLTLPYLNSIKGKVVDKTNSEPIEECCVIIQTKDREKQLDFWTDKSGTFVFYNIPEGDYKIIFVKKKYVLKEDYVPKVETVHLNQNQSMEFLIELDD